MDISLVYSQMFTALQKGGIDSIAKAAYNIMKMPVTITDATYLIVALYPTDKTGDKQWDSNRLGYPVIPEAILAYQQDKHWSAIRQADGAILLDWGYCSENPRYAAYLEQNEKLVGSLAFLIGNKAQEDWHLQAVSIIAQAASIVLGTNYSAHRSTAILKEMLMQSLLSGNISSQTQFTHMAELTNFSLHAKYVLASVIHRDTENELFSNYIGTELLRYFPDSLLVQQKPLFYILLDGDHLSSYQRSFQQINDSFKSADNLAVAFSYTFSNPLDLSQYKWQVDQLLKTPRQLYKDKIIFCFGDYISDIAMGFVVQNISKENMLHPILKTLECYDKEHETNYLITLKVYVQSLYNKNDTAHILNIHRNTLFYRLEKIQQITGVDINERKIAYHLFLSFHYMDLSSQ